MERTKFNCQVLASTFRRLRFLKWLMTLPLTRVYHIETLSLYQRKFLF